MKEKKGTVWFFQVNSIGSLLSVSVYFFRKSILFTKVELFLSWSRGRKTLLTWFMVEVTINLVSLTGNHERCDWHLQDTILYAFPGGYFSPVVLYYWVGAPKGPSFVKIVSYLRFSLFYDGWFIPGVIFFRYASFEDHPDHSKPGQLHHRFWTDRLLLFFLPPFEQETAVCAANFDQLLYCIFYLLYGCG